MMPVLIIVKLVVPVKNIVAVVAPEAHCYAGASWGHRGSVS